jgi:hypothetical protein
MAFLLGIHVALGSLVQRTWFLFLSYSYLVYNIDPVQGRS